MSPITSSLKNKLLTLLTVIIGVLLLVVSSGFYSSYGSMQDIHRIITTEIDNERQIVRMALDFKIQVQEWKNVLIRGHDAAQLDKYWGRFEQRESSIQSNGMQLLEKLADDQSRTLLQEFLREHQNMGTAYRKGLADFKAAGFDPKAGDLAVKGIDRAPTRLLEEAAGVIEKTSTENIDSMITAGEDGVMLSIYLLIPVLLVSAIIFVLFVQKNVITPAGKLKDYLAALAAGNFSQQLELSATDEFGAIATSARSVQQQLGTLISDIVSRSRKLNDDAGQLTAHSRSNLELIDRQNQQSEMVAVAMNQMSTTIQDVARNASDTAQRASEADSQARDGNSIVQSVVQSIGNLSMEVDNTSQVVNSVEAGAIEIGSVVDVINSIAEQTNLLALNAAIEAARAGDQGRGFAVVADEVRSLAAKTQESTEEIRNMIEKLQAGTKSAAQAMNKGLERVAESRELAGQADDALSRITESVSSINLANTQIASAAEEQGAVAEEINKNVAMIRDLANEVQQIAMKTDSASGGLSQLSSELEEMTGVFRT